VRRLDEAGHTGIVVERPPDLADAHLEDAVGDVGARPQRLEQLVLGERRPAFDARY
jgi:hypothetical protein